MSISQQILDDIKSEIDSKIEQRKAILSQLSLLDLQIDRYDTLIINLDKESLSLLGPINDSINSIQDSYEDVIDSGCKTDLAWVEIDRWIQKVQAGLGDGAVLYDVEFVKYEVKKNPDTRIITPYYGAKYYRKPSNRDYGSLVIVDFYGNVSNGSTIIAVVEEEGIPIEIQVDDIITDSIDSPKIFDTSDLPRVVGFGTTQSVGILTTLVGGISTGSNIFAHFGSGSLSGVETGMILINPDVLEENTFITGFGLTEVSVDYYTGGGILTSGILTCSSVILDKPAIDFVEEADFNVGIITISPAIFISTTASSTENTFLFTVFRAGNLDDIDKDFDPFKDPNAPLKIGILDASTLGFGHSIFLDNSGDPNDTQSYNPNKTFIDSRYQNRNDCLFKGDGTRRPNTEWDSENKQCIRKPEPDIGAGRAVYYEGTDQWPAIRTPILSGDTIIGYNEDYANFGDTVTVSTSSGITTGIDIGYILYGPGGQCSSGTLNSLFTAINVSETNSQNIIDQNLSGASSSINSTKALRRQRSEKELYAWSLIQAASNLRKQIETLQKEYSDLVSIDLSRYE